jgi:dTMP kinase
VELPLRLRKGTLVVFEGLNNTGKTTQLDRLRQACDEPMEAGAGLFAPAPLFTHQPSGATDLGEEIYSLTERVDWSKPGHQLTRQLLHLAAHNEHYVNDLIPALRRGSVIMDRCWWSAYAYGWRPGLRRQLGLREEEYLLLVTAPTRAHGWLRVHREDSCIAADRAGGIRPTVTFLFMNQFGEAEKRDAETGEVIDNYLDLAERYSATTELVPPMGVGDTTAFIAGALARRGLIMEG